MAFLVPLVIRTIPEVIAWPYPLGFDTVFFYVPWMLQGYPFNFSLLDLLRQTSLFPAVATLLNRWVISDPILVIKVLGPLLYGLLGISIYEFSIRGLRWSERKSLILVYVASVYFVSLCISWELYRQMLGTIFLLLALIAYTSFDGKARYLALSSCAVLVVMSHELVAVILLLSVMGDGVFNFLRKRYKSISVLKVALALVPAGVLFVCQRYGPTELGANVLIEVFKVDAITMATHVFGFLIYSFAFLVPLAAYGARRVGSGVVHSWFGISLALAIWPVAFPLAPAFWFRWAMFMVYPLAIYFTGGLCDLFSLAGGRSVVALKATAVLLILSLSVLSGYYIAAAPENSHPYFSDLNPYKTYIQSSMLQNTIPLEDVDSTIAALSWLEDRTNEHSVLILHEAFYAWALLYTHSPTSIILVRENKPLSAVTREPALGMLMDESSLVAENGYQVYTIWWANGKGWYMIPELPNQFSLLMQFGNIGAYAYVGEE